MVTLALEIDTSLIKQEKVLSASLMETKHVHAFA